MSSRYSDYVGRQMLAVQKLPLLGHYRGGDLVGGRGFAFVVGPVWLQSVIATVTVPHLSARETVQAALGQAVWGSLGSTQSWRDGPGCMKGSLDYSRTGLGLGCALTFSSEGWSHPCWQSWHNSGSEMLVVPNSLLPSFKLELVFLRARNTWDRV